jgi:hypothetical protein
MLPQKPDVLKLFFTIAFNLDKYDVLGKIVQNVENIDLRILLTITINISRLRNTITQHMFRNVRYSEIPDEFREFFLVVRFANDQEQKRSSAPSKTINTVQFRRDIEVLRAESGLVIEDILSLCMYFEQYDTASDLLSKINPELIKQNPALQGYKSLLQTRNNSKLVEEIANYQIEEDEKADLQFSAASSCIAANDLKGADEHLQAAIKAQPKNENFQQATFLAAVLAEDAEKMESSFKQMDAEVRDEMLSTFNVDEVLIEDEEKATDEVETADETEDLEIEFDHQKIHEHFQTIKAQRLASLSTFNIDSAGWKVKDVNVPLSEAILLGEHNGLTYFGFIAEMFDGPENNAFKLTLKEKRFAGRAEGVNGVKAFKGVFEIKIDGKVRLFTNKVYRNDQMQLLLYFDRYGNHDTVKKFARSNKRKVINC